MLITEQQESEIQTGCNSVFVSLQVLSRSTAVDIVNSSKVLQQETKMLLEGKLLVSGFSLSLSLARSCCMKYDKNIFCVYVCT